MSFNFTIKIQCYQSRLHAQLIITHTLLNGLILRTHQTASIRVVVWWPPKRITSWFSLCIFVGKQIKFFSDGDGNNFPGCKCRAWQWCQCCRLWTLFFCFQIKDLLIFRKKSTHNHNKETFIKDSNAVQKQSWQHWIS